MWIATGRYSEEDGEIIDQCYIIFVLFFKNVTANVEMNITDYTRT